jgi:ATP synthase F1 complex assembly factor 2
VLDQRNLRTPSKYIVKFPKEQRELALLTAAEWDVQTKNLKQHTLPLVI